MTDKKPAPARPRAAVKTEQPNQAPKRELSLIERLSEPFPADAISWRVGQTNIDKKTGEPPNGKKPMGLALAYIDARDVTGRLNSVCGMDWQREHVETAKGRTLCRIGVFDERRGHFVWRADGADDSDIEAAKGALSDSFKRAAVSWGIGAYLYGLDSPYVELERRGKSWIIAKHERAKLNRIASAPVSEWAKLIADSAPVIHEDDDEKQGAARPDQPVHRESPENSDLRDGENGVNASPKEPEERPAAKSAPAPTKKSERPDPGAWKPKKFPAPIPPTEAGWREWSRSIAAAIKAAPGGDAADKVVDLHTEELRQAEEFTDGLDMVEWAVGIRCKAHAPARNADAGPAR